MELRDRLTAHRPKRFVGRAPELAWFAAALAAAEPEFAVLQLHGAGGVGKSALLRMFADLAADAGRIRRFTAEWEGPASLRLRDGDPSVVAEYVKHGRIVDAGTVEQAEQAAARTWLADTLDGRDALLVVGNNAAARPELHHYGVIIGVAGS